MSDPSTREFLFTRTGTYLFTAIEGSMKLARERQKTYRRITIIPDRMTTP